MSARRLAAGPCALGAVGVVVDVAGVRAIWLGDAPAGLMAALRARWPDARPDDAGLAALLARAAALVDAPAAGWDEARDGALALEGTPFQRRVWAALAEVPPGATLTYAALAARLGQPRAVRAVAGACAANDLALAIPCHRVVRADGGLAGYRWGVARKRALLARERAAAPSARAPG